MSDQTAAAGRVVHEAFPTLALVAPSSGDAAARSPRLAQSSRAFASVSDLLSDSDPYAYSIYVVDGCLGMHDGLSLVRLLRRRSTAPIVAWRGRAPGAAWLDAGADVWLPITSGDVDLLAAVRALHRRVYAFGSGAVLALPSSDTWRLDTEAERLMPPTGEPIQLSATDVTVLQTFVDAQGVVIPYSTLSARLGHEGVDAANWLHATTYRLRRRIERATDKPAPLVSRARLGYEFIGRLTKL